MRKFCLITIVTLLFTNQSFGQYTWNGIMSNDFTVAANWSPNHSPDIGDILIFNTSKPITIINIGTQTIAGIIVSGGFPVSLKAANPFNILTINGATPLTLSASSSLLVSTFLTLQLNSSASISTGTFGIDPNTGGKIIINSTLNLSGSGILAFDVSGTGGTTINPSGIINYSAGSFICTTSGAINYQSGAVYIHALNGAAIPAATWQTGSFCNITGTTTIPPTGIDGIDFSNFIWNCASQAAAVDLLLPVATVNINGNLSIINTNGNYLRFSSITSGAIKAGSFTQTGGNIMLQSNSGANTLTVTNAFSQTGGIIDGVGNGSGGAATLDFKGNVTKTSATWDCSSTNAVAQMSIRFSGGASQTVSISGGAWNVTGAGRNNIAITNNAGGGVGLTTGTILKVINKSNSAAATCAIGGIVSPGAGAAISYEGTGIGGFTLLYNGTSFQTASAIEFPAVSGPTNLIINNSLGVKFPVGPGFSRTISGTLTMLAGNLAIESNNTLSLTNTSLASQLSYTTGYITTGNLERMFPSTGLPTSASNNGRFPFGTGVNERSLYVYFSSSIAGTAGMINVSHTPAVGVTGFSISDNGVSLDKRTDSKWDISKGSFTLGAATVALQAIGENIGAIDDIAPLRLTDGITSFGTLIASTGNTSKPTVGKTGLSIGALNTSLYIGSDGLAIYNPLIIITYTWTGEGANNNWTNPANWSGGGPGGYPSAPTEIAIITSTYNWQPFIDMNTNVGVYKLSLGASMTLGMVEGSSLTVYDDIPVFGGNTNFAPGSTFGYASPSGIQYVRDFAYGNLTLSGNAQKSFPSSIKVRGVYSISGQINPLFNNNEFIYEGSAAQYVTPANYCNLTITGNRGGGVITLGFPNNSSSNTIDILNVFKVSGLSNFTYQSMLPWLSYTTVKFSSPASQTIPGFRYPFEVASVNAPRKLDPLGSTNPNHVIYCRTMNRGTGAYDLTGSKINFYVTGLVNLKYTVWAQYNDLEFSGDLGNKTLNFHDGPLFISGKFNVLLNNYQQLANSTTYFVFNGLEDQTVYGHKSIVATNTPAFKYSNIIVEGINRTVTLSAIDTIKVTGSFQVPRGVIYTASGYGYVIDPFAAGKGFITTGSTVNFSSNSGLLPILKPISGTINYHNITVTGGTNILEGNLQLSGNLTVGGGDANAVTGASPALLRIGDGLNSRILDVLGDTVTVSGTSSTSQLTGQIDLNTGTTGNTTLNLSGSLFVAGRGQIMNTGVTNGTVIFKGNKLHNYTKTSPFNNDFVNFSVGDGVTSSKLTLLSSLDLVGSGVTTTTMGTLSVLSTDTLDCKIFNVFGASAAGYSKFDLKAGATLVTANTGGVEGTATFINNGSIRNDALIMKNYSPFASYIFNAQAHTNMSFPAATTPFPMANLTIGDSVNAAIFSLNKSIDVYNVLTFKKSVGLDLLNSNLTLKSTFSATCRVDQVPSMVSINYGGTGRFYVERYFPALRAWRMITAPLSGNNTTATIFSEWQNNGIYAPNIGTYITGASPNIATNGLDASSNNGYSLKTFQNNAYVNVGNTLTPISNSGTSAANIGYFLFVRGDRTASNFTIPNANNTTLSIKGKLQYGTQTFSGFTRMVADGSRKFSLIGNPYPSPVNFNSLTRVNLIKRFIVWDPKLATTGAFVTSDDLTNSGVYTQDIVRAGGQDVNIQSSQAFFIETDAAIGPSGITFNEGSKTTVNNLNLFRPASPVNSNNSLRSCLYYVNKDNSTQLADGNLVEFRDNFSNNVDLQDASKFSNINENFALLRNGNSIAMERRQPIVANDTLFFNLSRTTQRQYRFQFQPTGFYPGLIAFIEDSYLKTKTEVNLFDSTTHDFSISRDIKSVAANRFKIVFSTVPVEVLPVTFTNIKAYQQAVDIAVEWSVENEINITKYAVEKSVDGINFNKINITAATTANGSKNYKYVDINAVDGNNFYRILSYHLSGAVEYSRVLIVKIGKASASEISISPNPVNGSLIGLSFNNMKKGVYQLRIISALGQTVMTRRISLTQGNGMETINPGKKLIGGIYQLQITSPDKNITTIKMIVK